jgi:hypothetical protein
MDQPLNPGSDSGASDNVYKRNNSQTKAPVEAPKSRFGTSTKKKIQLSFENISITAMPLTKGCCGKKKNANEEPKLIINGVSGTIVPGQFLAILGASGKLYCIDVYDRCW